MENLGLRIRDERRKRKLTLEVLSQKTELSKSFLSQIERGLAQPSISSLKRVAREFGMSVVDLFPSESGLENNVGSLPPVKKNGQSYIAEVQVVRANRRKSLTLPGSYVSYDLLTPDLDRQVEVMSMRINPGEHSRREIRVRLERALGSEGGRKGLPVSSGRQHLLPGPFSPLLAGSGGRFDRGPLGFDAAEILMVSQNSICGVARLASGGFYQAIFPRAFKGLPKT
jgi:transcriptional regulator with XRE-family HTH domain